MALPANDAFSLGLAHDRPRRSSSRTPSLPRRSASPRLPFSSPPSPPPPKPVAAGMGSARRRKAPASRSQRSISRGLGSAATIEELVEEVDARIAAREARKSLSRNGAAVRSASQKPPGKAKANGEEPVTTVDWEIPRKALHSSIGFFTIYLWAADGSRERVIFALSTALAVLIPIDILRLRYPAFERAFENCVGIFMRDSEKKSSNGVIWYILGVDSVLCAFPLDIAVVSVLILSWADTAASTFGRMYGSRTPPLPSHLLGLPLARRKSLAGFMAAALTGAAVVAGFWSFVGPMRGPSALTWTWEGGVAGELSRAAGHAEGGPAFAGWTGIVTMALVAGLVTGIAEALDLGSIDDNLSLPIIAGGCLWGLFKALGWVASMFS